MASVLDVFARLLLDDSEFDPDAAVGKMKKAGKKMGDIGRKGLSRVTLPLAAFGALSVKTAVDFDTAMTGVRKTVDGTEDDFERLAQAARSNATATGVAAEEFLNVAAVAGQLGVAVGDLESFTDVMVGLGIATDLSSEQASLAIAQFMNVMGTAGSDVDELGSAIVALGNNMATQEGAIVDYAQRLAGAGKAAGLAESDVLGIGAALASLGIQSEAGATQVQKALIGMTEAVAIGGDDLEKWAAAAGMSVDEFTTLFKRDAAGAFQAFINGLATAGDQKFGILDDLGLSGERAIRVFGGLSEATDVLAQGIQVAGEGFEENTALGEETQRFYGSMAQQLLAAKEAFKAFAAPIGAIIVPMLLGLFERLQPIAQWFMDAPPLVQKGAVILGIFAAAIPPLLILMGFMVTSIGALTAVSLPWLLIIGAIIAAIAAIVLVFLFWGDIVEWFKDLWAKTLANVQSVWATVSAWILARWEDLKNGMTIIGTAIVTTVLGLWTDMKEGMQAIGDKIIEAVKWVFWHSIPGLLIQVIPKMLQLGKDIMNGLWDGLKAVWEDITSWVVDSFNSLVEKAKDVMGISSPSRVMMEVGTNMGDGLRIGLDASMPPSIPLGLEGGPRLGGGGRGGDTTNIFEITQLPGEDGEGLARRVAALVSDRQSRDIQRSTFG